MAAKCGVTRTMGAVPHAWECCHDAPSCQPGAHYIVYGEGATGLQFCVGLGFKAERYEMTCFGGNVRLRDNYFGYCGGCKRLVRSFQAGEGKEFGDKLKATAVHSSEGSCKGKIDQASVWRGLTTCDAHKKHKKQMELEASQKKKEENAPLSWASIVQPAKTASQHLIPIPPKIVKVQHVRSDEHCPPNQEQEAHHTRPLLLPTQHAPSSFAVANHNLAVPGPGHFFNAYHPGVNALPLRPNCFPGTFLPHPAQKMVKRSATSSFDPVASTRSSLQTKRQPPPQALPFHPAFPSMPPVERFGFGLDHLTHLFRCKHLMRHWLRSPPFASCTGTLLDQVEGSLTGIVYRETRTVALRGGRDFGVWVSELDRLLEARARSDPAGCPEGYEQDERGPGRSQNLKVRPAAEPRPLPVQASSSGGGRRRGDDSTGTGGGDGNSFDLLLMAAHELRHGDPTATNSEDRDRPTQDPPLSSGQLVQGNGPSQCASESELARGKRVSSLRCEFRSKRRRVGRTVTPAVRCGGTLSEVNLKHGDAAREEGEGKDGRPAVAVAAELRDLISVLVCSECAAVSVFCVTCDAVCRTCHTLADVNAGARVHFDARHRDLLPPNHAAGSAAPAVVVPTETTTDDVEESTGCDGMDVDSEDNPAAEPEAVWKTEGNQSAVTAVTGSKVASVPGADSAEKATQESVERIAEQTGEQSAEQAACAVGSNSRPDDVAVGTSAPGEGEELSLGAEGRGGRGGAQGGGQEGGGDTVEEQRAGCDGVDVNSEDKTAAQAEAAGKTEGNQDAAEGEAVSAPAADSAETVMQESQERAGEQAAGGGRLGRGRCELTERR